MKSWKTTSSGWVGAALILIADWYSATPHTLHIPVVMVALSVAGIGTAAKDHNVTGGTVLNQPAETNTQLLQQAAKEKG